MNLLQAIDESCAFIRAKTTAQPRVGIILGTGLGSLVRELEIECSIEYDEIPHMPQSTVESHHGILHFGKLAGKDVMVMQGRFHYYEGYSMQEITHPVRVMKRLGCDTLIVSNACGGMNPLFNRADVMIITDHINLLGDNPLIGKNYDELGPRFPDMSEPYTQLLIDLATNVALENKMRVHHGVYVAVSGPNLETKAEYRFLRTIGADVVGMSTVPEVIVARHMNMNVLGFSVITDECFPDSLKAVSIPEILEAARIAEPKLTTLVKGVLAKM